MMETTDWLMITSVTTAIGSLATAVGIIFAGWQIYLSKAIAQADFEDHMHQQYRAIAKDLPVDVLIGLPVPNLSENIVRELIFNWIDLSEEMAYLRSKKRISKETWLCWSSGIKSHLNKPAFKTVFNEVKEQGDFTYLERLIDSDFCEDPLNW